MRLFIAIDVPEALRTRLGAETDRLRPLAPNAKWEKPQNAHFTLAFLGEVAEGRVSGLKALLKRVAARHPAHALALKGTGTFGNRVLWVGTRSEPLVALQGDLAAELRAAGFALDEKPFHPHLTLARARDRRGDRDLAACLEPIDFGECPVDALVLFQSKTGPKGASYTALARAPLGAVAGPER